MTWFNVLPNSCLKLDERGNLIWSSVDMFPDGFIDYVFREKDKEDLMKIRETCECGSGSNLRGEGHSNWCKLYETERY